jgi:hypothetical protein
VANFLTWYLEGILCTSADSSKASWIGNCKRHLPGRLAGKDTWSELLRLSDGCHVKRHTEVNHPEPMRWKIRGGAGEVEMFNAGEDKDVVSSCGSCGLDCLYLRQVSVGRAKGGTKFALVGIATALPSKVISPAAPS